MVNLTKATFPGAEVVDVHWERMSYKEQARLALRAHAMIGIHGGNLQWVYMIRRGGLLLK